MGTWGTGLYANDLAADLKSTISSVLRLPFATNKLQKLLEESFPETSGDEEDEDYSSFWLVTADQFHKQGIDAPEIFSRARQIIDSGQDLKMAEKLDMSPADLRQRAKVLQKLRAQLAEPPAKKVRKTLSKPQPLVMNVGDVYLYPVFLHDNCINPYFAKWGHPQEKWRAVCVVQAGHIFGYLAYYRLVNLAAPVELTPKPTAEMLRRPIPWALRRPGTCSKQHFQRMQFELIDRVAIDPAKVAKLIPAGRDGRYQAVHDISISNELGGNKYNDGAIESLLEVMED
jgi:hypothetical protein